MPSTIKLSKPWRLSHVLEGHTSDVKGVYVSVVDNQVELIHSASRDETGRSWYREDQNDFHRGASYQGHRFQNAVVHVNVKLKQSTGMTILGGLDAQIRAFETKSSYSEKPQSKVLQTLFDHYDNVCHLGIHEKDTTTTQDQTLLISSSWDCTSKVWRLDDMDEQWHHLHTLKGHERAVWAAEVVCAEKDKEQYLTASADLFIRLWNGEELNRVFAGHTDVVRAITLLPLQSSSTKDATTTDLPSFYDQEALFVTASNDGSLRVWSLDSRRCPKGNSSSGGDPLRIFQSTESNDLLYDVKYAGHLEESNSRVVISCGEDGLIRGWNIEDGNLVMSIPQPVPSVWSLAVMPISGDFVTANSDAVVRVFTQRPISYDEEHTEGSIPQVTTAQLKDHEEKCQQLASKRTKSIEARAIADEATQEAGNNLSQYDQILQIDVSDDADPLPLGWNKGDEPRTAAKEFLNHHSLPSSYEDQLVAFIEQVSLK